MLFGIRWVGGKNEDELTERVPNSLLTCFPTCIAAGVLAKEVGYKQKQWFKFPTTNKNLKHHVDFIYHATKEFDKTISPDRMVTADQYDAFQCYLDSISSELQLLVYRWDDLDQDMEEIYRGGLDRRRIENRLHIVVCVSYVFPNL